MQICAHSVRINEIRGHVHFRSAGSGTKGVLETGNINEKQFNDNDRHFCQEKEKDMLSII